jgi:hypothetical protein
MSFLTIGAPSLPPNLQPSLYIPGTPAALLAEALAPLVEAERARLMDAERAAREANKGAAPRPVVTGLLGGALLSADAFNAEAKPWHEIAKEIPALVQFSQALGKLPGTLAQEIAALLAPPNWEVFFWMGRALEAGGANDAQRWREEADRARSEAEEIKRKTSERGAKAAEGRWSADGGAREQRQWWIAAWKAAKAKNPKLTKESFVERHMLAYLATKPSEIYSASTIRGKWLRGQ